MKEAALVGEVRESSFGGLGVDQLAYAFLERKIVWHLLVLVNKYLSRVSQKSFEKKLLQ